MSVKEQPSADAATVSGGKLKPHKKSGHLKHPKKADAAPVASRQLEGALKRRLLVGNLKAH